MRQMPIKLPAMFDLTPPHTLEKIIAKLVPMKDNLKALPSAQRSRS